MSLGLTLLAAVAAVNPFRVGAVLPQQDRRIVTAIGGLIALGFMALGALLSGPVLNGLDITTPTARIAAGVAIVIIGARAVLRDPPRPEPALPGHRAGIVPVAFPTLIDPGLALLVLAVANERGVAPAIAITTSALAIGLVAAVIVAPATTWLRIAHAIVGVIAMATGVAVTIAGVLDL